MSFHGNPMRWLSSLFPQTLIELHTPYNRNIKVIKNHNNISLQVNGVEQSGVYVNTLFRRAFERLAVSSPKPVRRILVMGVGGGMALRQLRAIFPQAHITGVDIDPVIIAVAKEYFGLDYLGNSSFIVSDARKYAEKRLARRNLFDLVIVDIFIGNDVPEFVTEKRFLQSVNNLLRPGGQLMMNYFRYSKQPEKTKIHTRTLSKIFQSVESENILRNTVFYCS
ncbi:hypothetical protein A3A63_04240 [Candidatus Gottesmanbacteria bacterium RIFCSPLOWO2_01_FULL_46_9]|uniref:PABS domain-containing protein n=1 Tax=Candidatus Gottesmanbacteria bacterium RIFCSPLOWO2_01_FULL_46_9 TaxID=1798394 RepID=A0A1F6B3Z7_9BACT|nr:MAG: hypothetical protein A3A63_04240 [Candidatus Gottesmanbacteria bacterium RIFCSPLOWO2_01_FULL_46_9]